jgi:hypothetical protein
MKTVPRIVLSAKKYPSPNNSKPSPKPRKSQKSKRRRRRPKEDVVEMIMKKKNLTSVNLQTSLLLRPNLSRRCRLRKQKPMVKIHHFLWKRKPATLSYKRILQTSYMP